MEGSLPGYFLLVVSKSSQEVITVAKKIENTLLHIIGLGFHSSANEAGDHGVCGWPVERGSPRSTRTRLFGDCCDKYIERKLSRREHTARLRQGEKMGGYSS